MFNQAEKVMVLEKSGRFEVALLIATALLILGALLGCDGIGTGEDAPDAMVDPGVLQHLDNGAVYCDIPSPTGDDPGAAEIDGRRLTVREVAMRSASMGSPVAFVVVEGAAEVAAACAAWDPAQSLTVRGIACEESAKQASLPPEECAVKMTSAECRDAAHDFVDSAGVPHCLRLVAPDGTSTCRPDVAGTKRCSVVGLGMFGRDPKRMAVCSSSGSFVGWSC